MNAKAFICGVKGHYLSALEHEFLLREQPYGVILFARNCDNPAQVKTLCAEIMNCLKHPFASILIDQEGGRVARLRPPHWRKYPPAAHFKCANEVKLNARVIAEELASVGITTNCAPLADVPIADAHDIIGDRAFGTTPEQVTRLARAQADGLMEGGILPILKHIPGHGRARADSHEELPVVDVSLEVLEASDFVPFRALRDIPLGMTAHILYTALDAKTVATQSKKVIDYIRTKIGFDGLLMSDDLSMKALTGTYAERTKATFAAGCDLALHCNGDMAQMRDVAAQSLELAGDALRRAQRAKSMMPLARTLSEAELKDWAKSVA
ncbi:MAG: beta-N-acetylhexosaminidase [Alphaproteobacteria bacterium]|nr:beta-N-acetylhexosaminidase [Alphaproteobacteria bacterium]